MCVLIQVDKVWEQMSTGLFKQDEAAETQFN